MKKTLILFMTLAFTGVYAQIYSPAEITTTSNNNNLGINQASPQARLHITENTNSTNCKPAILIDAISGSELGGLLPGDGMESNSAIACTTPYVFRVINHSASGNEVAFNISASGKTKIGAGINDIIGLTATTNILKSIGVYGATGHFLKVLAEEDDNIIVNWDSPQGDKTLDFINGMPGNSSSMKAFSLSPAGKAAVGDVAINPLFSLTVEEGMIVDEGRVGIGTQTPQAQLHIVDQTENPNTGDPNQVQGLLIENQGWRNHDFALEIRTGQRPQGAAMTNGRVFSVSNAGTVHIGPQLNWTIPDGEFKLWVEGGIRTEKVRVDIASENNWADYVFEDDYVLMPTEELEAYIKEHKHLPGVPSAKEVVEEGIDLAEMNKILLEKIEELTLRIIELEKANNEIERKL